MTSLGNYRVKLKVTSKHPVIIVSRYALRFLAWVTRGRLDLRYDMRTTTVGSTVYLGLGWVNKNPVSQVAEIEHEMEHVRQWRKWWMLYPVTYMLTLWSVLLPVIAALFGLPWWAGLLGAVIGCLLPAGLSMRAVWEYLAFRETVAVYAKAGQYQHTQRAQIAVHYAELLAGKPYFYAAAFCEALLFYAWMDWLAAHGIGFDE